MKRLRVVFFGGGGTFALRQLEAIARAHDVIGVVRARRRTPGWRARLRDAVTVWTRGGDPLTRAARKVGAPCWSTDRTVPSRVRERLAALAPDLGCVAGYRWLLPAAVYELPQLGTLNLHGSLLPRHRGLLPLFWIYHCDDRKTGVTLHWLTDGADAGPVADQEVFPLPRGMPVERLNELNAERGAAVWTRTLARVAGGQLTRQRQDDGLATAAPFVRPGTAMVRFDDWDVERVWHFLAGLCPHWLEPLRDPAGRPVRYRAVPGFETSPSSARPGTVEPVPDGYRLHCRGGVVQLR